MPTEEISVAGELDSSITREMRKELLTAFGPDQVARLHRANPVVDGLALVGVPLLFIANFFFLANVDNLVIALVLVFLQGWLMTIMGLLNHDLFVHRAWLGPTVSRVVGTFLIAPVQIPYSEYRRAHLLHHRHVGSNQDPETYKLSINTRFRRLVF